jgi:hypothetical protein
MKLKKVSVLSIVLILIMMGATANAYTLKEYKWKKSSPDSTLHVYLKWGDRLDDVPESVIAQGFSNAISDWNSSQSHIKYYTTTSSSKNILNSYTLMNDNEYGYCTVYYDSITKYISYFEAYVNAGNRNISKSNVARSAAAHELGHSYGLGDLTTGVAIMNGNRDRTRIYTPQTDDINGVNAHYR